MTPPQAIYWANRIMRQTGIMPTLHETDTDCWRLEAAIPTGQRRHLGSRADCRNFARDHRVSSTLAAERIAQTRRDFEAAALEMLNCAVEGIPA